MMEPKNRASVYRVWASEKIVYGPYDLITHLSQLLVERLRLLNKRDVDSLLMMQALTPVATTKAGGRNVRAEMV